MPLPFFTIFSLSVSIYFFFGISFCKRRPITNIIDFGCAINGDQSGIEYPWAGTVEFSALPTPDGKTYPSSDYESIVYTAIQHTQWLLPWSRFDSEVALEKKKRMKTKGNKGDRSRAAKCVYTMMKMKERERCMDKRTCDM